MREKESDDIRQRIRTDLGHEAFATRPFRAFWYAPLAAAAVGCLILLLTAVMPWYLCLAVGVVLGQCLAATGFLSHEVLHGSVVKHRRLQSILGNIGFLPMLITSSQWRVWHNHMHHAHTNRASDPDAFGTLRRYRRARSTRFVVGLAPGSGRPASMAFLGYWFTFHGQVVLWFQSRHLSGFAGLNRRRAKSGSVAALATWITIAVIAGPSRAVFAVVTPFLVANAITMSYIATNHFMRPMATSNRPLDNSMSVKTWRVLDRLHFNFSHHVEHHLFPKMSGARTPLVREWLRLHEPERYVCPAHAQALVWLYRTPRVYEDNTTLVDPLRSTGGRRVDTGDLALILQHAREPHRPTTKHKS